MSPNTRLCFRLTPGLASPEDVLAVSSRHASRHTRTDRLQLFCTQLWQEWQTRRQGRLGDKEGNESRFEGEGSKTREGTLTFFSLQRCICDRSKRGELVALPNKWCMKKKNLLFNFDSNIHIVSSFCSSFLLKLHDVYSWIKYSNPRLDVFLWLSPRNTLDVLCIIL